MNYTMKLSKNYLFASQQVNSTLLESPPMLILLPISQQSTASSSTVFSALLGLLFLSLAYFWCFCSSTIWLMLCLMILLVHVKLHYRPFHDLHCDRRQLHASCPYLWWTTDGLQHYFSIQWGTTIFGILCKIFAKKVNEKFSLALAWSWAGWSSLLLFSNR